MKLKIITLLAGIFLGTICIVSGLKTNTLKLVALFRTSTFTLTPSLTPTKTNTPSPTATETLTLTPTPTATRTAKVTPTRIPTRSSSNSTANDPPITTPIVIYAAGDIAYCKGNVLDRNTGAMITSNMLIKTSGPIFTLGDDSNADGKKMDYDECYNPTWGRLLARTYPVMGNHDIGPDSQGTAYFSYFAGMTGDSGHYSLDLGTWHIVILNSECSIGDQGCDAGSPQEKWLRADLKATHQKCIIALWHKPLFTSGRQPPFTPARSFWVDLYKYKTDIILNGHNHLYERFFKLNPDGIAADNGIREFVVGTGGAFLQPSPNPTVFGEMIRNPTTYGYLKLTLFTHSYQWQFVSQPGNSFTDWGGAECNR
jgi:hypothetical protein